MAQQRNTTSIFSALFATSAVDAKYRVVSGKSEDHFECFMQNKANLQKSQVSVNRIATRAYEKKIELDTW